MNRSSYVGQDRLKRSRDGMSRPAFFAYSVNLTIDSMKLIMERVICWRIPRLWLIERGAVSWQDGGKRSRWR